jgi:PDZ domain-containing protein
MRIRSYSLNRRLLTLVIIIVALVASNYFLSRNYTVVAPGATVNLREIVSVESGSKEGEGSFFLTTVSSRPLNIPLFIHAAYSPHVNIIKREKMIPPGWTIKDYLNYMKSWMEESQKIAEVVALRKAGYEPKILGEGAQIVGIMDESPAKGKLFQGDIIKKVDNKDITIADEVVKNISARAVGDVVQLQVERQGELVNVSVPTIESNNQEGQTIIGIYITTLNWKPVLPLEIRINTGNIGGPSAGSMFAMEILNQLSSKDLTKGKKVAGTGTIGCYWRGYICCQRFSVEWNKDQARGYFRNSRWQAIICRQGSEKGNG